MAETELRERIQGTIQELREVRQELRRRYESMMKTARPMLLVVAGYIGLKVGLWALRSVLSLAWRYSLLFAAMVGVMLVMRIRGR